MAVEVNQWVALFLAVCLVASSGALSTLDAAPSPSSSSFPYNYLNATNAIVNYVNQNGINFDTLAYICDTFGPRFRGMNLPLRGLSSPPFPSSHLYLRLTICLGPCALPIFSFFLEYFNSPVLFVLVILDFCFIPRGGTSWRTLVATRALSSPRF